MRILDLKAMRGPNHWSVKRHKLVIMRLDIEDLEEKPTDKIPGFYERITTLIPSLYKHRCSEDHEGGFYERLERGTWMGHVIEHIALEIQTLAGMDPTEQALLGAVGPWYPSEAHPRYHHQPYQQHRGGDRL